jgi:ribokinase
LIAHDLTVIGDFNLDILLEVPRFPDVDEEVEITSRRQSPGGDAANIAAAAARLGCSPLLIACAGAKDEGRALAADLQALGVDTHLMQWHPTLPTGCAIGIVRPDGQRNLLTDRGANRELHLGTAQREAVASSRRVHLSDPLPHIVTEVTAALTAKTLLSLDPGGITAERGLDALAPLLTRTEIFFSNTHEVHRLTGVASLPDAVQRIREAGPRTVVIKQAEQGCTVFTASAHFHIPGYAVAAVDATGAGDAFDAAFLTALLENQSLEQAAQFANAVGALTTLRVGAQTAQPTRQQVLEFMK